jgi:hypothetical protein
MVGKTCPGRKLIKDPFDFISSGDYSAKTSQKLQWAFRPPGNAFMPGGGLGLKD